MFESPISRRHLLLAAAVSAACSRPKATAFPGYAFVANQEGHSVAAVDLTHFHLRRQIRLDAAPTAVLAHPTQPKLLALAAATGTVYEIDATALEVSRRVCAGRQALGMRLSPAGDALWIVYRDPAEAVEVPLASFSPTRRIRLPAAPDDFDISRDGLAAFASVATSTVAVASLPQAAIVRTIATQSAPALARFQSDGRQLLIGSRADRSVTIFDTPTGRTVVRLPLPIEPRNFCFTSDGGQLFATGDGVDGVVIVYPYDTEVAETVLAGREPGAMAITDAPAYLLVSNPGANNVTVLDVDTRKLVALVNVGEEPGQIVITPDKQYALVLNRRSGDVAVIRISALAARHYKSAPLFTMIPVGEGPVSAAIVRIA